MKSNFLKSSFLSRMGIAHRLLIFIVLFSSFVTLIATLFQLYLDYDRDVNAIERRLDAVEKSYLDSIGASLWNLDLHQLNLQLEGIMRLPDIQAVEVREAEENLENPLVLKLGSRGSGSIISRNLVLTRVEQGRNRRIGQLYIEATLSEVYKRLIDKTVVILLSQGVKTFLVSLFILFTFYWLVTRHLATIASFLSKYDLRSPARLLELNRGKRNREDEFDQVVNALNDMSSSLAHAYDELRQVNLDLEQDIVARKNAEQEVKRLNAVLEERVQRRTASLEAANKELDAFCYSVSHDLRAPLRRVEGFRRILMEDYAEKFDEQGQHYLSRIEAGTREMADMIDSFLSLSRSSRVAVKMEQINLSDIANAIAKRLMEKEPERKVQLNIESGIVVKGDAKLFDVLLVNLLDNAWKYTKGNTRAKVEFGKDSSATRDVYYIRDNGIGFDMAHAERLFSPFARLHGNDEFEGVGVGLATVQRIIMRHGGRVWAESKPNEGAVFYFTLWEREMSG